MRGRESETAVAVDITLQRVATNLLRGLARSKSKLGFLAPLALIGVLTIQEVQFRPGDYPASSPQVTFTTRFRDRYRLSDYGFGQLTEGECRDGQHEVGVRLIYKHSRFDIRTGGQGNIPIYGYPSRLESC